MPRTTGRALRRVAGKRALERRWLGNAPSELLLAIALLLAAVRPGFPAVDFAGRSLASATIERQSLARLSDRGYGDDPADVARPKGTAGDVQDDTLPRQLLALDAVVVAQSVPATMEAGQAYAVSVTMRNTGTKTWAAGGPGFFRLGSQNPSDNLVWGRARADLASGDSIPSGADKTFSFTVTAPATAGTYDFQWQMLEEDVAWFGAFSPAQTVTVTAPIPVSFTGSLTSTSGFTFTTAFGDAYEDRALETPLSRNVGAGVLQLFPPDSLGLGDMFAAGRVNRDARLVDLDGDGHLDVISNAYSAITDSASVALLFLGAGDGTFAADPAFTSKAIGGYGETIGFEDVIVDGGAVCNTIVFLNAGVGFLRGDVPQVDALCGGFGAFAFADLNDDGLIDMARVIGHAAEGTTDQGTADFGVFLNQTQGTTRPFSIEVLGANGEQNQYGRVVRASPVSDGGVIFTRVVDGGSGYLSQNQYPLLIGTPYVEDHVVHVSYVGYQVSFTMAPGQAARVYADGRVFVGDYGAPPDTFTSVAATVEPYAGWPS